MTQKKTLGIADGNMRTVRKEKAGRDWTIIFVVWLVAVVIVYWPVICGRYTISPTNLMYTMPPWASQKVAVKGPVLSDPIDQMLPYLYPTYYGDGYSAWNGRIGLGIPVGIEVIINPFNWFFLLPLRYAYIVKSIFKFSLAYFGMCWFLRKLKLKWSAAAFGAVSYGFSSAMVMWHLWPHTDVMSLAPLALAASWNLIHEKRVRDMLILSVIVYLLLIAEMPSYGAYVLYLIGFYVLFGTISKYRKQIKSIICVYAEFGAAAALGIGMSLPYLQTLFSNVFDNGYASSRLDEARYTLSLSYLRLYVFPYFTKGLAGHPNEISGYFGLLGLILLFCSLFGIKRKKNYFWPATIAVLFILVYTHLLDWIFTRLPAVNTSLKIRIIAILVLAACVEAAISFNDLICHYKTYRRNPFVQAVFFGLLFLLFALCVKYAESAGAWPVYVAIAASLFVFGTIALIYLSNGKARRVICLLMVVLASANMGFYTQKYITLIDTDASIIPNKTDTIAYLIDNNDAKRIYTMEDWVLFPETNIFYGISCLTSHNFANTNADIRNFLSAADTELYRSPTRTSGLHVDNTDILRYAGVKYIVKKTDSDAETGDSVPVFTGEDGLTVYEVSDPAARFYLSGTLEACDSQETVLERMKQSYEPNSVYVVDGDVENAKTGEITAEDRVDVLKDDGDRIRLSVNSTADRLLVFNDYNHHNWTVTVDGVPAQVVTANYLFNAVEVAPGAHEVEFVFDTGTMKKLCVITAIIMGLIFAGLVATLIFEKRRIQPERGRP